MIKKIDILGIRLDNYTVRETVRQVESFLGGDAMIAIEQISMQMLIDSENDPVLKEVMSALDLTVIGEKEILKAAGIGTMQRLKETEDNDFSIEFFRRIERNKMSVFLLGETQERLAEVKEALNREFPRMISAGSYAVEHCKGDFETAINEMNATTPDVVVSILPSPLQEHFFHENKGKISAGIWYGTGGAGIGRRRSGVRTFLKNMVHLGKLKSSMIRYQEKNPEGKENEVH